MWNKAKFTTHSITDVSGGYDYNNQRQVCFKVVLLEGFGGLWQF